MSRELNIPRGAFVREFNRFLKCKFCQWERFGAEFPALKNWFSASQLTLFCGWWGCANPNRLEIAGFRLRIWIGTWESDWEQMAKPDWHLTKAPNWLCAEEFLSTERKSFLIKLFLSHSGQHSSLRSDKKWDMPFVASRSGREAWKDFSRFSWHWSHPWKWRRRENGDAQKRHQVPYGSRLIFESAN